MQILVNLKALKFKGLITGVDSGGQDSSYGLEKLAKAASYIEKFCGYPGASYFRKIAQHFTNIAETI